jgi:hypothetical protein
MIGTLWKNESIELKLVVISNNLSSNNFQLVDTPRVAAGIFKQNFNGAFGCRHWKAWY